MELGWVRDNRCDLSDEDYLRMVLKKTCWYSFIHPCRIGALIATRDGVDLDRFNRFGYFLGTAFQIQDDLLNLTGDEQRYGKEIGGRPARRQADADADSSAAPAGRTRSAACLRRFSGSPARSDRASDARWILRPDAIARQSRSRPDGVDAARGRHALRVHSGVRRCARFRREDVPASGHSYMVSRDRVGRRRTCGRLSTTADRIRRTGELGRRGQTVRSPWTRSVLFCARLIPFPGSRHTGRRCCAARSPPGGAGERTRRPRVLPRTCQQHAASIVAGGVDPRRGDGERRARARGAPRPHRTHDFGNPVLRQAHDSLTASQRSGRSCKAWPASTAAAPPALERRTEVDPLAEVRPPSDVRPGQRATISMTSATARAARFDSCPRRPICSGAEAAGSRSLLECTPAELGLEPQGRETDLSISRPCRLTRRRVLLRPARGERRGLPARADHGRSRLSRAVSRVGSAQSSSSACAARDRGCRILR